MMTAGHRGLDHKGVMRDCVQENEHEFCYAEWHCAAGVAPFVKQLGAAHRCPHSSKGGCQDCMPEDLRVREYPA